MSNLLPLPASWIVAAGAAPPFLAEVVILITASAAIAYLCQRLRMAPVVGYLIAGVAMGPKALGWVENMALVESAAELGVLLLLFTIGIEFSLDQLARIRTLVLVGGSLQLLGTIGVTTLILSLAGVDLRIAIYTGFLVSLSSTAILLKLLAERGEGSSEHGRATIGILIFQDLAVLAMVMLIPALAGQGGGREAIFALLQAAVLVVVIVGVARRVMPRILEAVAKTCSSEVFLLTVLAIGLGTAYGVSLFGVSLSLGAFLAGLMVSESRFSDHALGEILPLETLFTAVFFVSVGLLLDLGFLIRNLPLVLAVVAAVVVLKTLVTGLGMLALGRSLPMAGGVGLMLAQVGEFSFVLERSGHAMGLEPPGPGGQGGQVFIASTVLLMILTPALFGRGRMLARRRATARSLVDDSETFGDDEARRDHVILAGYGTHARRLAGFLHDRGTPVLVVTLSPEGAREAESRGLDTLRGDYAKRHVLQQAGLLRARIVIVADDEPERAAHAVRVIRQFAPDVRIVARAAIAAEADALIAAGANIAVANENAATAMLSRQTLILLQEAPEEIDRAIAALREELTLDAEAGTAASLRTRFELTSQERRSAKCRHVGQAKVVAPTTQGCAECLAHGGRWVHLRVCMTCGHVGCCDSSPGRHATKHFEATGHPLMKSAEPGEDWTWCYRDRTTLV